MAAGPNNAAAPQSGVPFVAGAPEAGDSLRRGSATPSGPVEGLTAPLKDVVFISFTGTDPAAKTFAASVLAPALKRAGINTFIDDQTLNPGNQWRRKLEDHAANSRMFVPLLTAGYGRRSWCMRELDLALHARAVAMGAKAGPHADDPNLPSVVPVYLDSPNAVIAGPEGNSGPSLESCWEAYWQRPDIDGYKLEAQWQADAGRWVENLRKLPGDVQASRLAKHRGSRDSDYQLTGEIVDIALQKMPPPFGLGKVVGLDGTVLDDLAKKDGLWIHGLGGIGKTTIAKVLYNMRFRDFHHRAFLELDNADDTAAVERHLQKALSQLDAPSRGDSASKDELVEQLRSFAKAHKALLVVDNVWKAMQIDALLPLDVAEGSCVIVTSRSQPEAFSNARPEVTQAISLMHHFNVKGISDVDQARQLLRHAAGIDAASRLGKELEDLEKGIIETAAGLPLALTLVGGYLRCGIKDKSRWEGVLRRLKEGRTFNDSEGKLKGVLLLSIEGLQEIERSMLLDVAAVFKDAARFRWDEVLAFWEAWHGRDAKLCFEALELRNLVERRGAGLWMHDVVVAQARGMLKDRQFKELYGTRRWVEDGKLICQQEEDAARPLLLDLHGFNGTARIANTTQLRLLWEEDTYSNPDLAGVLDPEAYTKAPPRHLLWLETGESIGARPLPWIEANKGLVVCALQGAHEIDQLHDNVFDRRPTLKRFNLSWCSSLAALPDGISGLTSLQQLRLWKCSSLAALPDGISGLRSLQELDLWKCSSLAALPDGISGLASLQELDLSECSSLASLPNGISGLTALCELKLPGCSSLGTLPDGISGLAALQVLNLWQCSSLTALPDPISGLTSLKELDLSGCSSLEALPDGISGLTTLQRLDVSGCSSLTALPVGITGLTALQKLDVSGSSSLTALPVGIAGLTALQKLDLSGCSSLAVLPDSISGLKLLRELHLPQCSSLTALLGAISGLTALQKLYLPQCSSLTALPDSICGLTALQKLDLSGCSLLKALPDGISALAALQELNLRWCASLAALPTAISGLTTLRELNVWKCTSLVALPGGISGLTALHVLNLWQCSSLAALPDGISGLTALQKLDLSGCSLLKALPDGINGLTALQRLDLSGCSTLTALPDAICGLTALQKLDLSGCSSLTALPQCSSLAALPDAISGLSSLQVLDLPQCSSLAALPDGISSLTALQKLNLSGCSSLTALPDGISNMTALRELKLSGCSSLAALPEGISGLTRLQVLNLWQCSSLAALPDGVSGLTALQKLDLSGCSSLVVLPDSISRLTALQKLDIRKCSSLAALPGVISGLTALRELDLPQCSSLAALHDAISGLTALQKLNLSFCSSLTALPDGISGLSSLQVLNLPQCSSLAALPDGISSLTALQKLNLSGCSSLAALPDGISGLTSLRELNISGCSSLQVLPPSWGSSDAPQAVQQAWRKHGQRNP